MTCFAWRPRLTAGPCVIFKNTGGITRYWQTSAACDTQPVLQEQAPRPHRSVLAAQPSARRRPGTSHGGAGSPSSAVRFAQGAVATCQEVTPAHLALESISASPFQINIFTSLGNHTWRPSRILRFLSRCCFERGKK